MSEPKKIRVGKRVAEAVVRQEDMSLAGVSDVVTDWRARMATRHGFRLFGATGEHASGMRSVGLEVAGTLDDLEKHEATGHSFVAEANYTSALDRDATRVVSCNTTSIVRTLSALKRAGLLQRARGTLLRRATDPWESHESGIMNTLVPEPEIPSHQGPDAQSVDPDLDVVTMASRSRRHWRICTTSRCR